MKTLSKTTSTDTVHVDMVEAGVNHTHIIPANQRVFTLRDQTALWFSLGVGLLVMQMGAYLLPALSTLEALIVIVIGSIAGSALLGWTAQLGAQSGLSSAGMMQFTYGHAFARLPIALNILQLLGWTAFELVIMRDGFTAMITTKSSWNAPWLSYGVTLIFGAVLFFLASFPMTGLVKKFIGKLALPLVIASLIWLTLQFGLKLNAQSGGWSAFWTKQGSGGMSPLSAFDLVIAMPISWLPLVADYARFARIDQGRLSSFKGTWFGYALANIWCYTLGMMIASSEPANMSLVSTILLSQFGLIALGIILIDEMDNAYGDVHSGSVSLHHISAKYPVKTWGRIMALLAIIAALFLDMHGLEPFLLTLSSIFIPLYSVIIAYHLNALPNVKQPHLMASNQTAARIHWPEVFIWLFGIGIYHICTYYAQSWNFGATLPTLSITFLAAIGVHKFKKNAHKSF